MENGKRPYACAETALRDIRTLIFHFNIIKINRKEKKASRQNGETMSEKAAPCNQKKRQEEEKRDRPFRLLYEKLLIITDY
jgi:hypothetical protein